MDGLFVPADRIYHRSRQIHYPDGSVFIQASDHAIFREPGWCSAKQITRPDPNAFMKKLERENPEGFMARIEDEGYAMESSDWMSAEEKKKAESLERAQRRARNSVRDLALSNEFKYFVTLTLDPAKIDRYDMRQICNKMRVWCDNLVRRRGFRYILVPELHKDGAVHFHGFVNDVLTAVDSGTLSNGGKPRRPRSKAERLQLIADGWHIVYNLPDWSLGFTTAIELYGERRQAVAYVLKYITKTAATSGKIGGRWYYSGGDLQRPTITYDDVDRVQLSEYSDSWTGTIEKLGATLTTLYVKGGEENGGEGEENNRY